MAKMTSSLPRTYIADSDIAHDRAIAEALQNKAYHLGEVTISYDMDRMREVSLLAFRRPLKVGDWFRSGTNPH